MKILKNIWILAKKDLHWFMNTWSSIFILGFMVFLFSFDVWTNNNFSIFKMDFFSTYVIILIACIISTRPLIEERRCKTISLLYSSPLSTLEIVLGKYLALMGFYGIMLFLFFGVYFVFWIYQPNVIYWPVTLHGFLMCFLCLGAVSSGSLFLSTVFIHQATASVASVLLWIGTISIANSLSEIITYKWGFFQDFLYEINYFSPFLQTVSIPVLVPRSILYFLLFSAFFLFLTMRSIEAQRWTSS